MPPEDVSADSDDALGEDAPDTGRSGLADWLWVPLLTAAIAAGVILIGRATFVA